MKSSYQRKADRWDRGRESVCKLLSDVDNCPDPDPGNRERIHHLQKAASHRGGSAGPRSNPSFGELTNSARSQG